MHPVPTGQRGHAHAVCAGCSHSVHFLVREPCSRSFRWFHRRADQRIVGLAFGLSIAADTLIPRGNQPLNPWSPVPAALHCVHPLTARLRPPRTPPAFGNEGIGKPEALKHDFAGYWLRRITHEHRLVYKTVGDEIRVAACRYHYGR